MGRVAAKGKRPRFARARAATGEDRMPASLSDMLHGWHDYFMLTGTASATLIGLMFVAASIGSSIFSEQHRAGMQAFITPTLVHFTLVLVLSLLMLAPTHTTATLTGGLSLIGGIGIAYAAAISLRITRTYAGLELADRFWYALIPVTGHLLVIGAALCAFAGEPAIALALLPVAMVMLLLAGLRNAWDMTLWIIERSPTVAIAEERRTE
jgi:hypothetical protein